MRYICFCYFFFTFLFFFSMVTYPIRRKRFFESTDSEEVMVPLPSPSSFPSPSHSHSHSHSRFDISFPLFPSFAFSTLPLSRSQRMRRLRIVAVLKFWVEERVADFAISEAVTSELTTFLEGMSSSFDFCWIDGRSFQRF